MRAVVQRVLSARVAVGARVVGEIGPGLLVYLGVHHSDATDAALALAAKVVQLRIFEDAAGKMNLSLADAGGGVLCVSQFTLYGNVRRGRRPSFEESAPSDVAQPLYGAFCEAVLAHGVTCERGEFGAEMRVESVNDGPVTLILDSEAFTRPRRA